MIQFDETFPTVIMMEEEEEEEGILPEGSEEENPVDPELDEV